MEDLILRSLGYLKTPSKFKKDFGEVKDKPSPKAKIVEKDGKVMLIYVWKKSDLMEEK